jgi:O-antigen/teichoic acid export membrane protein
MRSPRLPAARADDPSGVMATRRMSSLTRATRALRGQAVWSLLDQAVSSAGTLLLSIAVAQRSDATSFGAFATAVAVYSLAVTATRALVSMPFMMRAARDVAADDGLVTAALGAVAVASVPVSAAVLVAALLLPAPLSAFLGVLGFSLPFLLLQDAYRFVLRERDDARAAALSDVVWTVAQILVSTAVVLVVPGDGSLWHFAGWGAGVALATLYAGWAIGLRPHLARARAFAASTRKLGLPLLVEAFAIAGSGSAAQFALAGAGGLAATAPLKGAAVALGPINVVNGGLLFLITPLVLKTDLSRRRRLLLHCAAFGLVITVASLVTAIVLVALPDWVGAALLGDTWASAREVVVPSATALAGYGFQTAAMLGFRAHQVAVRTMVLHLINFPIPALCGIAGFAAAGVVGAAWGLCASATLTALALWVLLLRSTRSPAPGFPAGRCVPSSRG